MSPIPPSPQSRTSSTDAQTRRHAAAVTYAPPQQAGGSGQAGRLAYNGTAARNARRHTGTLLLRAVGLMITDVAALEVLRVTLGLLRDVPLVQALVEPVVGTGLPADFLVRGHYATALVLALWATGCYGRGDRRRDAGRILAAGVVAAAIPLWERLWLDPAIVGRELLWSAALLGLAVLVARTLLDALIGRVAASRLHRTVLVGPPERVAEEWSRAESMRTRGLQPVGTLLLDTRGADGGAKHVGRLADLVAEHRADTVLLCGMMDEVTFANVVRTAITAECRVLATTRRLDLPGVSPKIIRDRGRPIVELRSAGLRGQQLVLKRLLDIVGATALLLVFAPIMVVIAIAVRVGSPGPIVYGQARLGRHGRTFRCLKFRSMYPDAEQRLHADEELYAEYVRNDFKLPEGRDPRITPLGRLLRRTSLDELPQFWNVLRGDMSLVGPRPIVPKELCHYSGDEHMLLLLKPGITGSWQVNGRSSVGYPERSRMELDYVEEWSLGRDIMILLRTVPAVLLQRGAH